jgi:hypothetical protein
MPFTVEAVAVDDKEEDKKGYECEGVPSCFRETPREVQSKIILRI